MIIHKVTVRSEPPPRNYRRRYTPEERALQKKAVEAILSCEVGQHVQFDETEDRNRIQGFIRSAESHEATRQYALCRLDKHLFGVWRLR